MKTLDELLAHISRLEGRNAALEAENATLKSQLPAAGNGPAVNVTALTTERDSLKSDVATLQKENSGLKASLAEFDSKVTTKVVEGLVKFGIRTEGIPTNHKQSAGEDVNKLIASAVERAKNYMPSR